MKPVLQIASLLLTADKWAMARGAAATSNPALIDGDVILVPERRLFE